MLSHCVSLHWRVIYFSCLYEHLLFFFERKLSNVRGSACYVCPFINKKRHFFFKNWFKWIVKSKKSRILFVLIVDVFILVNHLPCAKKSVSTGENWTEFVWFIE